MSIQNSIQLTQNRQVPDSLGSEKFQALFGHEVDRGSGRNRSGIDKSGHAEVSGIVRVPVNIDVRFNLKIVRCTGILVALLLWALALGLPAMSEVPFPPCDANGENCAPQETGSDTKR